MFVTRNTDRLSRPWVYHGMTSDHAPVVIEYGDSRTKQDACNLKTFTNWAKFKEILEEADYLDIAPGTCPLEDSVRNLTFQITDSLARFSVTKVFRHSKFGVLPADLKERIREKNRLKNRAGDPAIND